jgi:hypothetical protein
VLLGAAPAVFQPRGGPSNPKSWHHKKSGAEHSIQRHSSSPTGLSGGCAKPIFDHAHERSAKRQGERGLILCPLSSNLPYRSRRVELRLQQRRKTEEPASNSRSRVTRPRSSRPLNSPLSDFPVTRNSRPRTGTEAGQGRWRSSAGPRDAMGQAARRWHHRRCG